MEKETVTHNLLARGIQAEVRLLEARRVSTKKAVHYQMRSDQAVLLGLNLLWQLVQLRTVATHQRKVLIMITTPSISITTKS